VSELLDLSPRRTRAGAFFVSVRTNLSFFLRDGTQVSLTNCAVNVNQDRTVQGTATQDGMCLSAGGTTVPFVGTRVEELTPDSITLRLPAIRITSASGAPMTVGETTVRAHVPGSQWLTPLRAYRP